MQKLQAERNEGVGLRVYARAAAWIEVPTAVGSTVGGVGAASLAEAGGTKQ